MKMIDRYNESKKKFDKSIILIKNGIFYVTFNDDAYIVNYLFGYKIKKFSHFVMSGFPEKVIEKIKSRLQKEKIHYILLSNNHQFVSDNNVSTLSNYEKLLNVSCKSYNIDMEILKIKDSLDILKGTKNIEEKINKIKEIM